MKNDNNTIKLPESALNDVSLGQHRIAYGILSFFIPFVLIIFVYIVAQIAPFGDHTLIISDARALYLSDLSFIQRFLLGKEDLFYSFQQGIGMNLIFSPGNFLDPATILVLFFDLSDFATLYSLIMAVDMSLCGLTMYLFLSQVAHGNPYRLIFSTCYALVGFNVANCFQYCFMLNVELLPLIAWGILNILRGKKPWLYIVSLGFAILSSFYFGYTLCIASVALFVTWYIKDHNIYRVRRREIFRNYILSSIVSGLIPALVWLPALSVLKDGRLDQNTLSDFSLANNFPIIDFFAKFFVGANNTDQLTNNGLPNVFCGTLAVFLVIVFFVDRRNNIRKKACYAGVILFYFLTFYVKAFTMIVQGFSSTNWFNYRYSYVFSFIVLLIGYMEFCDLWGINREDLKRSIVVFCLMVIAVFSKTYTFLNGSEMLISFVFLFIVLFLFIWSRKMPLIAPQKLVSVIILVVCCFEMSMNYIVSYNNICDWELRNTTLQDVIVCQQSVINTIKQNDSSFYRIGNEYSMNHGCNNDPRLFNYDGLCYFGSCERLFVFQGLGKLGSSWRARRIWYAEGEPCAFDSLFGAKYIVARRDLIEEKHYQELYKVNDDIVYLNPYALPIAMISSDNVNKVSLDSDPFSNHNSLWKTLSGINEDVFTLEENTNFTYHNGIDGIGISQKEARSINNSDYSGTYFGKYGNLSEEQCCVECTFTAQKDGAIYSYNGYLVDEVNGNSEETMKCLGCFKKGDVVTDFIILDEKFETVNEFNMFCSKYSIAYANDTALSAHSKALQDSAGSFEKVTDRHLIGEVSSASDSRIFFTIPYDEGWTLRIDGEITDLEKTADLFMSAPITKGNHSYELSFVPPKLKTGVIVSGCGVAILVLLICLNFLDKKRKI